MNAVYGPIFYYKREQNVKFQYAETFIPETIQKKFQILSLAALAQVQGSFLYQNEVDTFFAPFIWLWEFFAKPTAFSKYEE